MAGLQKKYVENERLPVKAFDIATKEVYGVYESRRDAATALKTSAQHIGQAIKYKHRIRFEGMKLALRNG